MINILGVIIALSDVSLRKCLLKSYKNYFLLFGVTL